MTYAYDDWVQMPTKDLYDTAVMKMAIDAAKDMYDKGQAQMENFYKTYGDFMSPFARDMHKYGSIMNNIRSTINDAYARGIDLFKSPEGRMLVQQLSHSIDPAWYNAAKANAKVGYEYLKAVQDAKAKNQFNPDFEKYAAQLPGESGNFEDFSTDSGKLWTRSAPYQYQDLNQYTGHIFDKMEDSFIETGEDHYDYYGVSREQRAKALTDNLAGILSTPLGKYHYEKAREHAAMLGKDYKDENVVMKQFQDDVLTSTTEYEHRNRKLNEIWKLQQEDASRQRAAIRSNSNPINQQNQYSIAELIRRTSSTRIVGQQTQEYSTKTLAAQRDRQLEIGAEISKITGGHSHTYKARQMFKNAYQDNNYNAQALADFIANQGFQKDESKANTIIIPKHALSRLSTLPELASNTTGFRGKRYKSNLRDILKDADVVRVTFTGGVYGAYMKNATNQNHFECIIETGKRQTFQKDKEDPTTAVSKYEWTPVKTTGSYFDSHITSQQDDPRLGYLGTVNKKGKINITTGIPITNSQDTKYQDAVASDVYTTAQYVKGSDYNFDASYTELTGYPR